MVRKQITKTFPTAGRTTDVAAQLQKTDLVAALREAVWKEKQESADRQQRRDPNPRRVVIVRGKITN
jgi:hypothetical protein